ncbi:hypothetical protein QBZ16_003962 [Prototheca wickerhamii]|uniref:JmjC domain-containing protein n=1 Tax=Prototheca wickerhamii TaxID=3111 RepID=A0AAD9IGL0_PROWI|nr:hypothetical protein QBZ16_003962 [Prototheca wickerhamii]
MTTTTSPAEPDVRHAGLARVDVRHCDELSYEAFVEEYMIPLKPVLIEGVARGWRSMEEWVCPSDGSIDLGFLAARFGESEVCVTDTSGTDGYGEGASRTMRLSDYVHWWRSRGSCGDQAGGAGSESLYVKDWHFAAEHPEYQAYTCPTYFCDDWLNSWYDRRRAEEETAAPTTSDYRFVYLGPAGTRTPVHHDVLMSHSWSINVSGTKRWLLVPPSHTAYLHSVTGADCLVPTLDAGRLSAAQREQFADVAKAAVLEVTQPAGQALFVPSGWHHEVVNATDALSINHNWINAACLPHLWAFLDAETTAARRLIEDCRPLCADEAEFEGLVGNNVRANAGLNWQDVRCLLESVARGGGVLDPGRGSVCSALAAATRDSQRVAGEWLARLLGTQPGAL